jgi:hypothetical protein
VRVVVFCGPTLPAERVRHELNAGSAPNRDEIFPEIRPPASRGDVLAAALSRPNVIALIDGYFDRVPSVWHKELS